MADFVEFKLVGGDKFMVDLQVWRDTLRADVRFVAAECAQNMVNEQVGAYKSTYHAVTGTLYTSTSRFSEAGANADAIRYKVSNKAFVAHLLERGTRPRFVKKMTNVPLGGGVFRRTLKRGRITANPIFVPAAIKWRTIFYNTVTQILRREVPGIGDGTPTVEER